MASLHLYLPGLLAVYAAITVAFTSPGPNFLGVVSSAVQHRSNGIFVGLGVSLGTAIWALFATTGISAIIASHRTAAYVLGTVGGLYLCWLGYKSLQSIGKSGNLTINDGAAAVPSQPFASLRKGLLIQLTNPKSLLFWLAITSLAVTPDSPAIVIFLLIFGCFVIAVIWHVFLALAFSSAPARKGYLKMKPAISFVFGLLFLGLGLKLAYANASALF